MNKNISLDDHILFLVKIISEIIKYDRVKILSMIMNLSSFNNNINREIRQLLQYIFMAIRLDRKVIISLFIDYFSINNKAFNQIVLEELCQKYSGYYEIPEIFDKIWGNNVVVGGRTIDVHVRKLREKLGRNYIETVKGVGYKFKLNE